MSPDIAIVGIGCRYPDARSFDELWRNALAGRRAFRAIPDRRLRLDISLDPFELVGFARLGALAEGAMRIYDRHPTGFLPGEGAGAVVLLRRADAEQRGLRIHAVIRGWGVSSDGHGGITRPNPVGHEAAIDRCYARARIGIETVALFEGHGTGTEVGDAAELTAITGAVRAARAQRPVAQNPAIGPAIGSIKALIGHTKAAAGVAGLIKAVGAVRDRLIPPSFGVDEPHAALAGSDAVLRAPAAIEAWPDDGPARAGVSAIGFGGINVHVTVEGAPATLRRGLSAATRRLALTPQDAELFVLSARDPEALAARAQALAVLAGGASLAELTDLAAKLAAEEPQGAVRAAIVAASPDELRASLEAIAQAAAGRRALFDGAQGRFWAATPHNVRIGLLFTGQASPVPPDGGALARRFPPAAQIWRQVPAPRGGDRIDTRYAQPAIVAASLAVATILEDLGVTGDIAVGHSLGELSALAWAGCWTAASAIELAVARGTAMAAASPVAGAMTGLGTDATTARTLVAGTEAVIAAYNGPAQTVISGPRPAVEAVMRRAAASGIAVAPLATSHAFHSPLMAGAASPLRQALRALPPTHLGYLRYPARAVISTVTGRLHHGDPAQLLVDQLTSPVRFSDALGVMGELDLLVEVGPGQVLASLAAGITQAPIIAVDACGRSLRGLLAALGAAWTLGKNVDVRELFADRWCKPIDLETPPSLFANPCEAARPTGPVRAAPPKPWPAPRATIHDVVTAFCDDARLAHAPPIAGTPAASWVRAFATVDEPAEPPHSSRRSGGDWRWHGMAPPPTQLAEALQDTGGGTVIVLSGGDDAPTITSAIARDSDTGPFLVLDPRRIGGGFARTLHLETGQPVTLVSFEGQGSAAVLASVRAEAAGQGGGFRAVHVGRDGTLTTPVFEAIALGATPAFALGPDDVVLVTGGGKGIAAECALALAERSGCRIATVGRQAPEADRALAKNLERFAARGVRALHVAADVTDAGALAGAVRTVVEAMGPITVIIHAAGINEPRALRELTTGDLRRTIAPKLAGLTHAVAAVDRSRLRSIVAFGSIIARTGLPGEAHYALANDLLRRAMEQLQGELPACQCAVLEWSAWAEVGMAERIGRLDALVQQGLSPIAIEDGVGMFLRAFGRAGSIVIAGRLGNAGIAAFRSRPLPLARFVERPLLHVPGVELISEVELSPAIDLYADDHVVRERHPGDRRQAAEEVDPREQRGAGPRRAADQEPERDGSDDRTDEPPRHPVERSHRMNDQPPGAEFVENAVATSPGAGTVPNGNAPAAHATHHPASTTRPISTGRPKLRPRAGPVISAPTAEPRWGSHHEDPASG